MILHPIGFWGVASPVVSLDNDTNSKSKTNTCTVKVKIASDGDYYESNNAGSYVAGAAQTWLDSGTSSQVWVERTMVSGSDTLTYDDIGGSRVSCSSDLELGYQNSAADDSTISGTVTLDFYDAASGGTLLDTANITIAATSLNPA
jgi:hypothetical protein